MNWQKAKTVLLIALLVTDIFLAGVLLVDQKRIAPREDSIAFHRETKKLLEKNGITLAASIPKDGEHLPILDVEYEHDTADNWNARMFQGKGKITTDRDQYLTIEGDHAKLKVTDNRHLIYTADHTSNRSLEQKEAEQVAKSFLEKRKFSTRDMQLVTAEQEGNRWQLTYTCMYNDRHVESTYTEVDILGDAVVKMDRLWVNVIAETDGEKPLPLASQSLLRLLSHESLKGRTIEAIDPCYYFNLEDQGSVENLSHATRGYSTVAWRMVLDGGEELVLLR